MMLFRLCSLRFKIHMNFKLSFIFNYFCPQMYPIQCRLRSQALAWVLPWSSLNISVFNSFTNGSVFIREGEVWRKKISNNNFRTIIQGFCCLLPSPSYCNMVYALRLTRFRLSLLLYFNERSAVKGRARHACDPSTSDWERVRLYGRGGPFL